MSTSSNNASTPALGLGNTTGVPGNLSAQGSNASGFTMPNGQNPAAAQSPNVAGLTGTQSGMTMPTQPTITSGNIPFTMPTGGGQLPANMLGMGSNIQGSSAKPNQIGSPGGKLSVRAQHFAAPIADMVGQNGSQAGNSLIGMLQKYQVGNGS